MSELIDGLANRIAASAGFRGASDGLFNSYAHSLVGEDEKLSREEIVKLVKSVQYFYKSNENSLRTEGAILLSMILDVYAREYPEIALISRSVFAEVGDFPNIKLLSKNFSDLSFQVGVFSEAQIEFREELNTVEELPFALTNYQRVLWEHLITGEDVITSAPTSAGKTYIILNHLVEKISQNEGGFAAIIVPTRALISEVAAKIYDLINEAEEIEVCTVPREGEFKAKTFFVMTQERMHELLLQGDIFFDYVFIDEAHNISDKSRGVLLHLTIQKILENSFPQIVISMPSSNYRNSFSSIFDGVDFTQHLSDHSPVAKVVMNVEFNGRNLDVSRIHSDKTVKIKKEFKGTKLANVALRLGRDQSNIIYQNKTNYCEDVADEITSHLKDFETTPELEEAASYVEEFIHDDFSLAKNLRSGVAFHYGPLPASIRVMVENLAKEEQIKFIVCTGTLAEGVNLPAKNLFLKNPQHQVPLEAATRIEDVKVKNITGRAGRMMEHFSGNIFLVEPSRWRFDDYFEPEIDMEEKIPTYYKSLNEELPLVLEALQGEYDHTNKDQYRMYTIANKLIKEYESETLDRTFASDVLTLSENDQERIRHFTRAAFENLRVASFTLEANPSIGYIQQNKLFDFLQNIVDYRDWILPHPRSPKLLETLTRVAETLNKLGLYIPTENQSISQNCLIAQKWMQGRSLKEIISEQIDWENQESEERQNVNRVVRNVIKLINNDISFRLSNALRCYQILLDTVLAGEGLELTNVRLHSFIEIGACDERMINLINIGLTRDAAKEIDKKLNTNITIQTSTDLLRRQSDGTLDDLHPIVKKEVAKLISN